MRVSLTLGPPLSFVHVKALGEERVLYDGADRALQRVERAVEVVIGGALGGGLLLLKGVVATLAAIQPGRDVVQVASGDVLTDHVAADAALLVIVSMAVVCLDSHVRLQLGVAVNV